MITLTPAYGRDYTSQAKVRAAWAAGQDFIVASITDRYCGKPANCNDIKVPVMLRYAKLRKVVCSAR